MNCIILYIFVVELARDDGVVTSANNEDLSLVPVDSDPSSSSLEMSENGGSPTPLAIEDRPKSSLTIQDHAVVPYNENKVRILQQEARAKLAELQKHQDAVAEKSKEVCSTCCTYK